jgi:Kef-type K+ transport system membrane component KefB
VAFVLGGRLTGGMLRARGREILAVSLAVVGATITVVAGGLMLLGVAAPLALLLAAVATATDPAATQDVVRQTGASGPFTDRLLGVVAIDDAWGLIAFGLILIAAASLDGAPPADAALDAAQEFGGALAVGVVVGLPAAALTGRLRPGEPMQLEALGIVFLCAGLALWVGASFLLAGMLAGALVANLARHHDRPFHEIENLEWPFLVLFFLLAGASLDLAALEHVGLIGAAYIVLRLAARLAGGVLGARLAAMPRAEGAWSGAALTPQAGIAVGMALVAAHRFPDFGDALVTIAVATTVVFELIGPLLTRLALSRTGALPGGEAEVRD